MSKIYKAAAAMAVFAVILIAVTGSAAAGMSAPQRAVKLDDRVHRIEPETTLTSSGRSSSK